MELMKDGEEGGRKGAAYELGIILVLFEPNFCQLVSSTESARAKTRKIYWYIYIHDMLVLYIVLRRRISL